MPKAASQAKPAVDPIFAVIETHKAAFAPYQRFAFPLDRDLNEPEQEEYGLLAEVMIRLHHELYDARATTRAGRTALRDYKKQIDATGLIENPWTLTPAETRAVRARLMLIAHERPTITPEEIKKAMTSEQRLHDFRDRHQIAIGWLFGDPKYCLHFLLSMTQKYRRSRSFATVACQ